MPFATYIFSLEFKEKPNYNKLRFLLEKNLMERNMVPSNDFDWLNSKKNEENDKFISDESLIMASDGFEELKMESKNTNKKL